MLQTEKERNSSIELLRIFLMFMILALHINKDLLLTNSFAGSILNIKFLRIVESVAVISVNCFVLITGFFSAYSNKLNVGKIISLVALTCFYGGIVYLLFCLIGTEKFTVKEFIKCTIPFFFDIHWFINIYLILTLLAPFINKMTAELTQKSFLLLLFVLFILFSVWPSFLPNPPSTDKGYGVISFVLLYCIGSYLRMYATPLPLLHSFLAFIFFSCVTYILFSNYGWRWINYNSVFNILSAIMLFMVFLKINFFSKTINKIAKSVIAIYLIHTNQAIRPYIFVKWFAIQNCLYENVFIVKYCLVVLSVFVICIIVDIGRRFLHEKIIPPSILSRLSRIKNYKIEI